MPIPQHIKIKGKQLPDRPGVYFYYDKSGDILYVGKATSLKKRVGSYFNKAHDDRIAELVSRIARIDYIETQTVIEALVLEANQIKALQPPYNIQQRDDKSFLYLTITNEPYPKPVLFRGNELAKLEVNPFDDKLSKEAKKKFLAIYGPYTSGNQLRKALDYLRKIIPWSDCDPPSVRNSKRPCFYAQIKKCPGVCTGEISQKEYKKVIRNLMLFFEGEKKRLIKTLRKEMKQASAKREYERAAQLRNNISALEHIQDVALITKEDVSLPLAEVEPESGIDLEGRIEAYDISNISGTSNVGSMVVFEEGKPAKHEYRKFKIKTVKGANDTASMAEMIERRLKRAKQYKHAWKLPELMVIDGGKAQVNAVKRILRRYEVEVPVIGIAKGLDRKQDRLVYDRGNEELLRVAQRGKPLFQKARDEAHRFAVKYHKTLRAKRSGVKKKSR